ncbi:MAG TPA: sugar transferase [Gemmataceae bacterium]|nr:sugar transferase [Gemmataceae bacterium]
MATVLQETASQPSAPRNSQGRAIVRRAGFPATKRLLDIAVASVALLVAGPLILIAAILVKLTTRGPAFYRAKRAGLWGQPFIMFKLRTMRTGTDSPDRKITADEDDRVTPVGWWLRKFKIDEVPQFWNVLRGDMAIVGPRPEDWDIVERYYTAEQRRSLDVRPGIASPVDVNWYPDLTYHDPAPPGVPMQEHYLQRHLPVQVAEAIRYVERQSLWLDAEVILRMIFCVLVRSWLPSVKQLPVVRPESSQGVVATTANSRTPCEDSGRAPLPSREK